MKTNNSPPLPPQSEMQQQQYGQTSPLSLISSDAAKLATNVKWFKFVQWSRTLHFEKQELY